MIVLRPVAKRLRQAQPDNRTTAVSVSVTLSLAKGNYNASYI